MHYNITFPLPYSNDLKYAVSMKWLLLQQDNLFKQTHFENNCLPSLFSATKSDNGFDTNVTTHNCGASIIHSHIVGESWEGATEKMNNWALMKITTYTCSFVWIIMLFVSVSPLQHRTVPLRIFCLARPNCLTPWCEMVLNL